MRYVIAMATLVAGLFFAPLYAGAQGVQQASTVVVDENVVVKPGYTFKRKMWVTREGSFVDGKANAEVNLWAGVDYEVIFKRSVPDAEEYVLLKSYPQFMTEAYGHGAIVFEYIRKEYVDYVVPPPEVRTSLGRTN